MGVALLVGLTVLLAAVGGAVVGFGEALTEPTPGASFSGSLSATDGWPDGQRLRLVHDAGDSLPVADIAVVAEIPRVDGRARLTGFPTRRLDGEHVRGRNVFDGTYAGVDGELDAAHTDGHWQSGEAAELRIAQGDLDLERGDRMRIRVVHRPTGGTVGRVEVVAT